MCSLFVCACSCVLCFVNAWKINVTCLVKVLSKNGSRGQKYTRERLFGGLSSGCALSIISLLFLSLSLSLGVVSTTY
jgi:hypothetical protein